MNRYSALLSVLILTHTFSSNAIMMNNQGVTTEKGFVSWELFIDLPKQVNKMERKVDNMQRLLILGSVVIAGYLIYSKWFKESSNSTTDAQVNADTDNKVA